MSRGLTLVFQRDSGKLAHYVFSDKGIPTRVFAVCSYVVALQNLRQSLASTSLMIRPSLPLVTAAGHCASLTAIEER